MPACADVHALCAKLDEQISGERSGLAGWVGGRSESGGRGVFGGFQAAAVVPSWSCGAKVAPCSTKGVFVQCFVGNPICNHSMYGICVYIHLRNQCMYCRYSSTECLDLTSPFSPSGHSPNCPECREEYNTATAYPDYLPGASETHLLHLQHGSLCDQAGFRMGGGLREGRRSMSDCLSLSYTD